VPWRVAAMERDCGLGEASLGEASVAGRHVPWHICSLRCPAPDHHR
jgi:hypothetical protein